MGIGWRSEVGKGKRRQAERGGTRRDENKREAGEVRTRGDGGERNE